MALLDDELSLPSVVDMIEQVARTPPILKQPVVEAGVKRSERIKRRNSVMEVRNYDMPLSKSIDTDEGNKKMITTKKAAFEDTLSETSSIAGISKSLRRRRSSVMEETNYDMPLPKSMETDEGNKKKIITKKAAFEDTFSETSPKAGISKSLRRRGSSVMDANVSALDGDIQKIKLNPNSESPKTRRQSVMDANVSALDGDIQKIKLNPNSESPKTRRQSVMDANVSALDGDIQKIKLNPNSESPKTRRQSAMKKSVEDVSSPLHAKKDSHTSKIDVVDKVLPTPTQTVNVKVTLTRSPLIDHQTSAIHCRSLTETKSPLKPLNSSASKLSLSKEKKVEKKNFKGETQLQIACRSGNKILVSELLAKGANPNHSDNAKWTPLHDATRKGNYAICELLIQNGAVVTIPGLDNDTALHIAVQLGYEEIAKLLYSNNADLHAKNSRGQTPYELATPALRDIFNDMPIHSQSQAIENMSMLQSMTDFENAYVVGVDLSKGSTILLNKLAKIHKDRFTLDTKLSNKTTHVITDVVENKCPLTVKVLQAIAQRLWIISSKWIYESNHNEDLLDMKDYEIDGVEGFAENGPKKARISRLKKLPKLFNGCSIYFKGLTQDFPYSKGVLLNRNILQNIVTESEGVVLRREPNPEHASDESKLPHYATRHGKLEHCSHYIVYATSTQPCYNMKHLKALPLAWFVDSLCNYQLIEPE